MRATRLALAAAALTAPIMLSSGGARAQPERVTVMTYNLGNLFDAAADPRFPNRDSAETLRSAAALEAHAEAVARVIARFDLRRGPDVLVLTEVESRAALDAVRAALPDGGAAYATQVIFDSDPSRPPPRPDRRGIDVALLARLPVQPGTVPRALPVDLTREPRCRGDDGAPGSTRDLLEVALTLPGGAPLTVFGVHFPSGSNPRICREIAARALTAAAAALPPDRVVVAAGDFNFNCAAEEQAGLRAALPGWSLPPQIDNACRGAGSQFFRAERTWSFLDVIAQREDAAAAWRLDHRTFRVVLSDLEQVVWDEGADALRPKSFRFDENSGQGSGTSDHWPVASDLVRR